jgi:hypothetical protein
MTNPVYGLIKTEMDRLKCITSYMRRPCTLPVRSRTCS